MSLLSARRCFPLLAQILLALIGIPVLASYPPANGPILLVPLSAEARAAVVPAAVGHGARLVAPGRLPGSVIVSGRRAAISDALSGRAVLMLAADAPGCGRAPREIV